VIVAAAEPKLVDLKVPAIAHRKLVANTPMEDDFDLHLDKGVECHSIL